MQSKPKSIPSLTVALRDSLENDILTGHFRQGERLDEARLALRYQVSRTPVREALMQLASSGIVEIRPHRGAFVAEPSATDLIEMFEFMAELEGMCGRLAARRIVPERQAALLQAHRNCGEAERNGTPDDYYYANEVFHQEIYASSRNSYLEKQARALHQRLRPYRRFQLKVPGRIKTSYEEHQKIIDAIFASDSDAAERELRAHVLIQGNRFSDFIAALQDRKNPASLSG